MAAPGTDRSAIRFLLNGEPVDVEDLSPQTTLLEYLREQRHLTGTKEGCAEGDCGACTVVLADPADGGLRWRPVNACIRPLPSVDGKAVVTVEGAARRRMAQLHPVQRALVDCHGSQCGFCTPGFAMSLFGLYKNASAPTRARHRERAVGQSVPLHRLPSDRGRRRRRCTTRHAPAPAPAGARPGMAADGSRMTSARRATPGRGTGVARPHGHLRLRRGRPTLVGAPVARRARRIAGRASAGADRRGRDGRRPVGHQAPAASGRHPLRGRRGRTAAAIRRTGDGLEIGAARLAHRCVRRARRRLARARARCGRASRRCRSATAARSAAMWPTARRSATRCRR